MSGKDLLRAFILALCLTTVSCKEHKRLAMEAEKAKAEYVGNKALLAQMDQDFRALDQSIDAMRRDPAMRAGNGLDAQVNGLETKVGVLTLQRDNLRKEVEALKKDLAKYQSANL